MKTKLIILTLVLAVFAGNAEARKVVKVRATNYDISDNLDLEAVASLFGDSKDLNDFEYRLNDPRNEISNLDLNEDRYIDYLRVVEFYEEETRFIAIQAVLGEDIFQDVATIELERDGRNEYSMIIVGNHFIYGENYFIRPVYVHRPTIFDVFFGIHYRPWHSPYYWGYYPTFYTYRAPYRVNVYRNHIHNHINRHHQYEYLSQRNYQHSYDYYSKHGRNDYGSRHPERSFEKRNDGMKSKSELNQNRRSGQPNTQGYRDSKKSIQPNENKSRRSVSGENNTPRSVIPGNKSTRKEVQRPSESRERRSIEPSQNKSENVSTPSNRSESKPAVREREVPRQEKSQSVSGKKQEIPKVNKSEPRRSSTTTETKTRKPEQSVKKQAPEKKVEKKTTTESKPTENRR